jgi:hypothetical protein
MTSARDDILTPLPHEAAAPAAPLCPVDRLPSRRRNRICLRIIVIGGLNFLLYTITYAAIGGDAVNGWVEAAEGVSGGERHYFVRGHFIRSIHGKEGQVTAATWHYSYLHSISLPLTSGAMIVSMLVLARPHIVATMRDGLMTGRTFIAAFSVLVIAISLIVAGLFTWDYLSAFKTI